VRLQRAQDELAFDDYVRENYPMPRSNLPWATGLVSAFVSFVVGMFSW
jgi:hypothetical protein